MPGKRLISAPTPPSRSKRQKRPSSWSWSRLLGLVGTLSLHGVAIQTIIVGSNHHKRQPPEVQGAEVGLVDPAAAPAEELVLVTVADAQKYDSGIKAQIVAFEPRLEKLPIPIISPDPSPVVDFEAADNAPEPATRATSEAGDPAVLALMFGRYTGQIRARVERAWTRPRSAVRDDVADAPRREVAGDPAADGDTFKCRAQIRQDALGNVQEVLLVDCNGSEAWRHSLVIAINQSSPLPAPPIPSVFAPQLTLAFEAQAYQQGDASDAYEIEPRHVVHALANASTTGMPARAPSNGVGAVHKEGAP